MKVFVKTKNLGTLNCRVAPNKASAVIAQIPYGTELEVDNLNSEWIEVEYKGKKGFVMREFLSSSSTITREDVKRIYDSLESALKIIKEVLN